MHLAACGSLARLAEEEAGHVSLGRWALGRRTGAERPGCRLVRCFHRAFVLIFSKVFT